jgi:cytochrome c554/c'-like protein
MGTPLGIPFGRIRQSLVLLAVLGCTDTVVRDREPFNPPPDAANKFLGFFTASDKQTTCGNCHVLHQRDWAGTAHSNAYELLAGNPDATDACFTCHTVSDRGNAVAAPAGWDVVHDTSYYEVQCENCHGPGLDHVQNPDAPQSASNPPLAHIALLGPGGVPDSAAQAQSCGACHNQNSGPGVRAFEEWERSGHARPVQEEGGGSPADEPNCASCHEGKAILAAWGVTADYAEKGQTGSENNLGQVCAVCHDPHGTAKDANRNTLEGQLRFPIDSADANVNLCMKCHQRRSVPDVASSRGPHSPQGPMLLGDAGYQPAGFQPDLQAVATTHGSEKNPRLCAGCHVNRLTGTDITTGKPATSAGHLFLAIPCLDAGGLPNLNDQSCTHDEASRSWGACTASGCHASASAAVSAMALSGQRLDQLTKQIWDDKNHNDTIDVAPTDGGYLSDFINVPPTEYSTTDARTTPAEGARFNVRMLRPGTREEGGGVDGSTGVHNPFLAEALLRANIDELKAAYPGLPAASTAVQEILRGPLGAITKRPLSRPLIARPISSR